MITPHSTLHTPTHHSPLNTHQSTLPTPQFLLYTHHSPLITLHPTLPTLQYTHHSFTLHSPLYTSRSTPPTLHRLLYTLHWQLTSDHFLLPTLYSPLYTHLSLTTPHSTVHSAFYTPHSFITYFLDWRVSWLKAENSFSMPADPVFTPCHTLNHNH